MAFIGTGSKHVADIKRQELRQNTGDQTKYFVAHLKDGSQLHEHNYRWIDVPLRDIVMLELTVLGNKYVLEKKNLPITFVEFVQFKTAKKITLGGLDNTISHCIGWHDGVNEYVIRVDANTGKRLEYIEVFSPPKHLHPQSRLLIGN